MWRKVSWKHSASCSEREPEGTVDVARVGAAEGCDLLILILKTKIKRSQPSAARDLWLGLPVRRLQIQRRQLRRKIQRLQYRIIVAIHVRLKQIGRASCRERV